MSYLGTTKIGKLYLGTTSLGKLYLGDDLIFQQGGSPAQYDAQIEYLQSADGGQYIDLGFIATQNIAFTMNIYRPDNSKIWDCGSEVGWSERITRFIIIQGNSYAHWRYGNGGTGSGITAASNCVGDMTVTVNKNNISIEKQPSGTTYTASAPTAASFTTPGNFLLFGYTYGTSAAVTLNSLTAGTRIKNALFTDTNVNLDLIAVRIGSVGYLYDRNSGRYFPNKGTGAFILGPDVTP